MCEDGMGGLIKDKMKINEKTKREIKFARKEFKEGKFKTHAQLKKELDL